MDLSFCLRFASLLLLLGLGAASLNHLGQFSRKHHEDDRITNDLSPLFGHNTHRKKFRPAPTGSLHTEDDTQRTHHNHIKQMIGNMNSISQTGSLHTKEETQQRTDHNHITQLNGNMNSISHTGSLHTKEETQQRTHHNHITQLNGNMNSISQTDMRPREEDNRIPISHQKESLRHRHLTKHSPVSIPKAHEEMHSSTDDDIPEVKEECRCQNGGRCIMKVVCLCASEYYGIRCQHKLHHHSCGELRHGTWVRSRCNLCRCEDGNMLCMIGDLDDCDNANSLDEEEEIIEPEVMENIGFKPYVHEEPRTATLTNKMAELEEEPILTFHYRLFPPYTYKSRSSAMFTTSTHFTVLLVCLTSFVYIT